MLYFLAEGSSNIIIWIFSLLPEEQIKSFDVEKVFAFPQEVSK